MLKKLGLALALSGSLFAGAAGIAAAQGAGPQDKATLLQKYDTNGDGKLEPNERAAMRADFQAKREARKAAMLARFDTNKDGKLDKAERKVMRETLATEAFEKMDLDHNGSISLAEFKEARGQFMRHHRGGKKFGRRMNGGADKP